MPLCNDPVKIIVHCNNEEYVYDALFSYGVVDHITCQDGKSTVTFAWWFPIGVGADLRTKMQSNMISYVKVRGRNVLVERKHCHYSRSNKEKKLVIKEKNPYCSKESKRSTIILRNKKGALETLYG